MPSGWYVYFIQAGADGPIKIGRAKDPMRRLAGFQTGSHEELFLLGTIPAEPELERQIHAWFEEDRIRGEWFRPSSRVRVVAYWAMVNRGRYENETEAWQLAEELRPILRREKLLPKHDPEIRSFVEFLKERAKPRKRPANRGNRGEV